jgi:hypothetical protein
MQSQTPDSAYFGLWNRIEGFDPAELADLMLRRRVVRIALMRSTIHLVTAADCMPLRALVQPVLDRGLQGSWGSRLVGANQAGIAAQGRELVEQEPMTFSELGARLAPAHPGFDPDALAMGVRTWVPLVQVPPRGVWQRSGRSAHTTAEHWLGTGAVAATDEAMESMVLRYVAAFGPAGVADAQKWSGLTRLRAVFDRLAGRLVPFRDADGALLYDLPDAPRPDPDTDAPARLLAEYDNLLLSHADRGRVLGDTDPRLVMTPNGLVLGAVLVDGFAVGRWRIARPPDGSATVTVTTWRRLRPADRDAVTTEALALLAFAAPERDAHDVRFDVSSEPAGSAAASR